MSEPNGKPVEKSLWIDAPPALVRSYFLESDKMAAWSGKGADLDPRPGGHYRLDMGIAGVLQGRFTSVEDLKIVQEIDMPSENGTGDNGVTRIEITFEPEAGGTRLTIVHSGLPHPFGIIATRGWDHHLARLSVVVTGGTNAPDSLCHRPMESLI